MASRHDLRSTSAIAQRKAAFEELATLLADLGEGRAVSARIDALAAELDAAI